ncbi:site-specific DNA-methyltransferase, partial [Fusobacterium sp.]|uniref:site-specific DNA-methyltransferase n=1 Tax=Fusobacterium sp. TaxID=68766 RepID=UPI0025C58552
SVENKKLNGEKIHPTQKPIELVEKLILDSTKENETVLDCFMGSGSTGVACIKNNRRFIGYELDENYYKNVEIRIKKFL